MLPIMREDVIGIVLLCGDAKTMVCNICGSGRCVGVVDVWGW